MPRTLAQHRTLATHRGLAISRTLATQRGLATEAGFKDGLMAYWKLEETSGTRQSSYGSIPLTDVNSVGTEAGKHGLAASFTVGSDQLLTTEEGVAAEWLTGAEFTVSAWLRLGAKDAEMAAIGRYGFGGLDYVDELLLTYDAIADRFRLYVSNGPDLGGFTLLVAETFGSPVINDWVHVVCGRRGGNIFLRVNNQENTEVYEGAPALNNPVPFTLGNAFDTANIPWEGAIDEVAVWNRALTEDELTQLWNGGAGKFYDDF